MIRIEIPGCPVPKARPRFCRGRTYSTQGAEVAAARTHVMRALKDETLVLKLNVAYRYAAKYYVPFPASWSKAKKSRSEERPCIARPDVDNYTKFYMDVLNGLAYPDDGQVFAISAEKRYSENPRTVIIVSIEL